MPDPVWDLHAKRAPTRKTALTLDRVIAAATELADAKGLDAVTMSAVAKRAGFTTMALYRHVRNKDELLLRMVDAGLGPPPPLDAKGDGWRASLEQWTETMLGLLMQHPWVLRVPLAALPPTPSQLAWLDRGLEALAGTPLTEQEKAATILVLNGHVFWEARMGADMAQGASAGAGEPAWSGARLAAVASKDDFPALHRAIAAGVFDDGDDDADRRYGLDRILDGVERLIESR